MDLAATAPLYIYGVTDATTAPAVRGLDGAAVELVERDGLRALVSELTSADTHDGLGREDLATHAAVLAEARTHGTVLPMRFGVVMEDADAIADRLLDAHRDDLLAQLQELEGKVELRVRVLYEPDALMREVVTNHPEIAGRRAAIKDRPLESTYYQRIELGEMVAAAVQRTRERDIEELLGELEPLAVAFHTGEPKHERVVLDASFLVAEDDVAEFDRAVDGLGGRTQGRMRFKYTGPLPPYSFVELQGSEQWD